MEVETNVIDNPINLSRYPAEILDLIASFLSFEDIESEQEFIERTRALKIKEIPQKYLSDLPFLEIRCSAYCPNNATIALLEKCHSNKEGRACRKGGSTRLVIIDRKNNSQKNFNIGSFSTKYFQVALSREGNLIATVHSEIDITASKQHEDIRYKDMLVILNTSTQKTEPYNIPDYFELKRDRECSTIAFNKEGTEIILYGYDQRQLNLSTIYTDISEDDIRPYIIIPLTVNTPNPDPDNKKTLEKYFKQQMICKEFNKKTMTIK